MKYRWLLLVLLLVACEDNLPTSTDNGVTLNGIINPRLGEPDENGYYHIKLGNKWQTIHRLSGLLWYEGLVELEEGEKYPAENGKLGNLCVTELVTTIACSPSRTRDFWNCKARFSCQTTNSD